MGPPEESFGRVFEVCAQDPPPLLHFKIFPFPFPSSRSQKQLDLKAHWDSERRAFETAANENVSDDDADLGDRSSYSFAKRTDLVYSFGGAERVKPEPVRPCSDG